jgi:hypothetical protein
MLTRRVAATMLALGVIFWAAGAEAQSYRTYAEIGQILEDAASDYPSICQFHALGRSVQGRNIWALNISDNVGTEEDEPEFKYISTAHGDEWVGNEMLLYLIDDMLPNYGTDPQITNLIDEVDIWIVPLMNPDGFDHSPSPTRYNANGVDLNRDFPCPYTSPGDTPQGREIETGVIMNWTGKNTFTLSANMHAGALVVNYPFDANSSGSSTYTPTPDDDMFIYISEAYSWYNQPMWNGSFYHGITNGADWYVIYGGMQDWSYVYRGCNEVTLELSNIKIPSASLIPQYWDENRDSMLSYMETCLIGIRGIVTGTGGEPLACTITVAGRDHEIYSDPDVGDYHRMLLEGVYDLTFEAEGYPPLTFQDIPVSPGEATRLDVSLEAVPPVTYDVEVYADTEVATAITLLGYDPNGDPIDFVVTSLPSHGSLSDPLGGDITSVPYTLASAGKVVTYTSDAYLGLDSFLFKANDGGTPPDGGDSNESTVSVTVIPWPPTITTDTLPDGALGVPYGPVQLEVSGGLEPLEWSVPPSMEYIETDLGSSQFAEVGTAQGWHADDHLWVYTLPFTFPFFGSDYSDIRVCSNGFVDFGSFDGYSEDNSTENLVSNKMIAPLWDDLRTDGTGYDIYVDESEPNEVTIRWDARTYYGSYSANFSLTLTDEGIIRFHYGSGNTNLTCTVGLSNGDGTNYFIASYDGSSTLTNANSLEFEAPDGLPDGMTFSTSGVLSGTPTEMGTFTPTFIVADALERSDERTIELVIMEMLPADGDCDNDGDVDLVDMRALQECFGSSGVQPCNDAFDFVADGQIDLDDYAEFVNEITGPQQIE